MNMEPRIDYLPDESVDDSLDKEIRDLLTTCFTKPQDIVFRDQRYFREPYPNRWAIRNAEGILVAHIGVHDKAINAGDMTFRVGGICEVCVHPDCRGRGYVRMMLKLIHKWLTEHDFTFAILFSNPLVYGSSGYAEVANLFNGDEVKGWTPAKVLVRELCETPWPNGKVLMPGPGF